MAGVFRGIAEKILFSLGFLSDVSISSPNVNDVLTYNGTVWTNQASAGGGTVTTTGSPANGNLTKFSGATSITNGDLSGGVTTSGSLVTTVVTNANLTGPVTSIGNATTLVGSVPFSAPSTVAVGNATVLLMAKAAFSGTINSLLAAQTTSGTITLAIKINGTNVTGLSAVSVTSTPEDTNATAANTFAAGDIISAVTSSAASDLGLSYNLKITRT